MAMTHALINSQFSPGGLGGATGVEGVSSRKEGCSMFVMHVEYLLLADF